MAQPIEIEAAYSTSAQIKGLWHRFEFTMRVALDENDDTDSVKERLWNTVTTEVEKQVYELIEGD